MTLQESTNSKNKVEKMIKHRGGGLYVIYSTEDAGRGYCILRIHRPTPRYITNLYRGPQGMETGLLDCAHCTTETALCYATGYSVAT